LIDGARLGRVVEFFLTDLDRIRASVISESPWAKSAQHPINVKQLERDQLDGNYFVCGFLSLGVEVEGFVFWNGRKNVVEN
jgi:hypothetical protein